MIAINDSQPSIVERAEKIISNNTDEFKSYIKSVVVCFGNHDKSTSQNDKRKRKEIYDAQSFTGFCVPIMVPNLHMEE